MGKTGLFAALLTAVNCAVFAETGGRQTADPRLNDGIIVGVTNYGEPGRDRFDMMTNDYCNLWVQWAKPENLTPEKLGRPWYDWARTNGIYVMTIYGQQNGAMTKRLKELWGERYLGNNIGEYAGFLYQDEKSYSKNWPRLSNLKEAHEWLVGEMLAAPKKKQLERRPEEREPLLFSTSGSPLACYELDGGIDFICNEMYAVGSGNLAYATAEARGAAKRRGINWWSAWLAHEWQTCWPRVPYGVPQKMDSLEVGLKEMWLMGTSMMVLESGSQTTQAHDYTPPDGTMKEFKTAKQGYDGAAPEAYRRTMREFYRWTKDNPRAPGMPEVHAALVLGNYDGYVGMTWDTFAIFGQHHLAATNSNWRVGAPEFTWEAMMEAFYPRPVDAMKPYANGWLGGSPHGQVDVVNVDDALKADELKSYKVLVFGGWNTMTEKIASTLRTYVSKGGEVLLCTPQLSARVDREYSDYTAKDLVQAVPGVKVKEHFLSEDILMLAPGAPEFLKRAYPAHLSAKLRVADVELDAGVEVVATMGKKPYLVRAPHGKGAFWLCLAWDYPAARREMEEFPSYRNFRLDFWRTLAVGLVETAQPFLVSGEGRDYVNWSVYGDTVYLLNTDCVSPRSVELSGQRCTLAPKELKKIVRGSSDLDGVKPLWPDGFPDPTAWRAEDGSWRATSTTLKILKSDDFLHWTDTGAKVFTKDDEADIRKRWRNIWAPDVFKLNGEYLIYVSLITNAANSAIAVYSSKSPDGPFTGERIITKSRDTGIDDTIDPEVVRDDRDGTLWLFFGSIGGMHRVKLAPDGKSLAKDAKYEPVAGLRFNAKDDPTRSKVFEGAYLHRRNGWWYLFASRGCYYNHTYAVVVGRAKTLDGPFLDREGRRMTEGFATTVIASKKEDRIFGPGHNGEIRIIDGRDCIPVHAHVRGESAKGRQLFLVELTWDEEGWPTGRFKKMKAEDR